jgi:hypothetical protein
VAAPVDSGTWLRQLSRCTRERIRFDSDPARDAQPPHNSADLPGAGTAPRVSVEARFFAFFE